MASVAPKYPLYGDVAASVANMRTKSRENISDMREMLAYMKVSGVNAAKWYVRYRDREEDWAKQAAAKAETNLIKISRKMQRLMGVISLGENLDKCRNAAVEAARQRTEPGQITIGTLQEYEVLDGPTISEVFEAKRQEILAADAAGALEYSPATLAPFTEMWKECMKLIDSSEEFDLTMFLGEDPVFSTTVLATTCPISREPYRNVVRTQCNHRFNRSSIESLFQSNGYRPQKCPIAACGFTVSPGGYVPDPEYENKVKASEKRRREQTQRDLQGIATLD